MKPTAVVTGGASNIGWACVRRLAATHTVWIADLQAPDAALPGACTYMKLDITDEHGCAQLFEQTGPVAALVHSAAITVPARPMQDIALSEWRRVIEVNLTGAFVVAQAARGALAAAQGAMVFIASRAARTGVAALQPTPAGIKPHYAAAKAGLMSLARSLAVEWAASGVRVNTVVPGSIEGAMIPRERWPELAARIPLGRLGTPEEVAEAAAFLCSDAARYITGHALDVNGGSWMN